MLVVQIPSKIDSNVEKAFLVGEEFEVKTKEIEGETYIWGELKNKEKNVLIRKIEKVFHLVSSLQNSLDVTFSFYDLGSKDKTNIIEVLEGSKI